ncbi:MAG: sodium:proton antiporter [Cycloclasticus sp.]|jgi:NhaD family Na+/H+ antiporter|uniref:Na+/H+ antiporter NhaD-related arsenite permease n=1 Tax=Cycloclasticus zancles 78-ME TaxID=1198232 RepID=S5TWQ4_9GAMM|nr:MULTISPECIES: sodium:proton antiporter NhaD [Cycloclasticus]HAI96649.1 sodium:proton antiporter [Methylococcaceae bacterium]AGS39600.1 Na+/H+ antiporter NhaD-related arsenite permease [Cycloclasticus zancles 78-ME]MAV29805.1 sodium:proton antiporter [Cycloclasticus sp.]MBG95281.1 sodium:proton antiporter [Cycloclasticus sp.]MBV1899874.1 sodium:proton antiporter NhaD [Cycloclasticus sp.]
MKILMILAALLLLITPCLAWSSSATYQPIDLTSTIVGYLSLLVFALAYTLVIFEEQLHLRKSKPVLLAAGLIWIMIAIAYKTHGYDHAAEIALRHNFLEYAELFFFLLVAMTYINAMIERKVFDALRGWLIDKGFSYKNLFWLTGTLAFFISPVADNLTTALIMCTVVLTVGKNAPKFVSISCISIVVGANAGGAFSPFGDITTLMVWQKGLLQFTEFFNLFIPSLVNYLVPAAIMSAFIPAGMPNSVDDNETLLIKRGGLTIVMLFALTILTAVCFHNFLHLPPAIGMMTGLAYLKFFSYYLKISEHSRNSPGFEERFQEGSKDNAQTDFREFDVFDKVAGAEWDTLFFFYGVIMAVGGLGFLGYLGLASEFIYGDLGPTTANVLLGLMSAIVDNIPVMFAVLTMSPDMSQGQWLLVTLTAGVGGSLLSIGSAAGVALMGQARGIYTFASHLKWAPVIALGYAASIYVHMWINAGLF